MANLDKNYGYGMDMPYGDPRGLIAMDVTSLKMMYDLIDVLYTYKHVFASDNYPLGAIRGNEVYITLNIDRPYPPVLRRPAYPPIPGVREAL
ncbi:hypothetical protein O181_069986 [Austropuccinia psidii MF-1]|uniref:Uncharacterized protein n=1 Tax=Austropuccinia psidii MF-1 TaxID=1389203 RepID=A0A9Q3F4I1_9BASI|nr:hypothetical protein [Austropuccinia psidii MF-1]